MGKINYTIDREDKNLFIIIIQQQMLCVKTSHTLQQIKSKYSRHNLHGKSKSPLRSTLNLRELQTQRNNVSDNFQGDRYREQKIVMSARYQKTGKIIKNKRNENLLFNQTQFLNSTRNFCTPDKLYSKKQLLATSSTNLAKTIAKSFNNTHDISQRYGNKNYQKREPIRNYIQNKVEPQKDIKCLDSKRCIQSIDKLQQKIKLILFNN